MKQMFCPKCKSKDIQMCIPNAWSASLGLHPGWKCNKCGFELPEFPESQRKMKIIFICKYNAFRSRVAEEYFKKINKNSKIETLSRGFIMGGNSDKEQRKISKEILGINIAKRKPLPIKINELKEADLIVVVANDIPKIMFNYSLAPLYKKLIIWKIKDEQKRNKSNINKIVLSIKERVENLNETLEKK